MTAILAAVVVIGIIAICVGPFCYCRQPAKKNDGPDNCTEASAGSSVVQIKIKRPHSTDSNDLCCECDSKVNVVEATDAPEKTSLRTKCMKIVPVKPPRKCHKIKIDQASDNVGDSNSSLMPQCGSNLSSEHGQYALRRAVRARIEANSKDLELAKSDLPEVRKCESCNDAGSSMSTVYKNIPHQIKSRRLSEVMSCKWKHFKSFLTHSRSNSAHSIKGHEADEVQRLGVPISSTCRRSPIGHSTMLSKNRIVDRSTASYVSVNSHNLEYSNKIVSRQEASAKDRHVTLIESARMTNEIKLDEKLPYVTNEIQAVEESMALVQLEKLRSTEGKSTCDVKIMGLTLSQSELLQFLEATNGRSQTASIATSEESAVISIRFHHRRTMDHRVHEDFGFVYECPLKRLCRLLPEKLEVMRLSKIFRSEGREQSLAGHSPVHVSIQNGSAGRSNESSEVGSPYVEAPQIEEAVVAGEECFSR